MFKFWSSYWDLGTYLNVLLSEELLPGYSEGQFEIKMNVVLQ